MNKKGNIIIVEGAQGSGKTTLTNYLRDNIPCSNLYRLTGIKDKEITGLKKVEKMYISLLNYIEELSEMNLTLIFDRLFFTELVYSNLGFKEYSFDKVYDMLLDKLSTLNYNIYLVILYRHDISLYSKILKRDHHNYQQFSINSSINQQKEYIKIADNIEKDSIKVVKLCIDDYDNAYNNLKKIIPLFNEE